MINTKVLERVRKELVNFIIEKQYDDVETTNLSTVPDMFESSEDYRQVFEPHVWEELKRRVKSKSTATDTFEKLKRSIKDGCMQIGLKDVTYGADLAIVRIQGKIGVLTKQNSKKKNTFQLNFPHRVPDGSVTIEFIDTMSEVLKLLYALEVVPLNSQHIDTILGKKPAIELDDDLADELEVRYNLKPAQAIAVSRFMNAKHGIQILQGPPGTGKTHTIVSIIKEILNRSDGSRQIVICTPANSGLESLAEKLIANKISFDIVARKEKIDSEFHSRVVLLQNISKRIILCTLAKCMKICDKVHDVDVIIDESGQATDPTTLLAFLLRPVRCLLVGDTNQLLPHVEHGIQVHHNFGRSMMKRLELVLFNKLELSVHTLDLCFRCTAAMIEFVNKSFYGDQLVSTVNRTLLADEGLGNMSYFMIDVDGYSLKDRNINRKEAIAVIKFAEYYLTRPGIQSSDIVVLCDYTDQKEYIEKELFKKKLKIRVMTTDSSQGNEYKIVLVSFVRTHRSSAFFSNPNRLNVKLTRAMECLVLFGNFNKLMRIGRGNIIGKLMEDLQSRCLVQSLQQSFVLPDVHQILLGVNQNELRNYFDIIKVPYGVTLQIKKAEADSLSSTIQSELLQRAANYFGISNPSENVLHTIRLFVARKFNQIDSVEQVEVLHTLAQFHLLNSQDEYPTYLELFEQYYNNDVYPISVRLLAKTTALWIQYRNLALAGEGFHCLIPAYIQLDQEYRDADLHATKYLLQWGIVLLRLEEYTLAIEKFNQVSATTMNEIHALNFDDVYSSMCLAGEILHRNLPDTKKSKQKLIKHFEAAINLSMTFAMPRSWAYEMLAGYYMDCQNYSLANYNSLQALQRHSGNIHAYRVLVDSRDKILSL